MLVFYFLLWTFILYWIHRIAHSSSVLKRYHWDHHRFINLAGFEKSKWEINNLILFNDTRTSTVDLWITEVIPTIIFSLLTDQWWIFIFYYCWAAIFQEVIEHKKGFNLHGLTSGDWHLIHHKSPDKNFGLFIPVWDIVFRTYKKCNVV
jgi:sterol desaturase/sphingolipid hydroxylase (fatty acid hydroxylase superfamily)